MRDARQTAWQNDEVRIMVATNAFGMGIDKPDVRLVIHMDCPSSIEAYFQEAGRAGRDGRKAYAVMIYNGNDRRKLEKRIDDTFPPKEYIQQVYEQLAYYFQMALGDGYGVTREFDIGLFCYSFKHFPTRVDSALKLLSRAGWIHYETDPDNATRIRFLLERDELYLLNDTTPREEAVITTLLRTYSGLFTDYAYISIGRIARECNLTEDEVYQQLKALNHRRIVHFIPQRTTPTITYLQRREPSENITIPKSIYEDRRELFAKRIRAVWFYCENNETCRSRQLISYFGEENAHDCGQCDVCLKRATYSTKEKASAHAEAVAEASETIIQWLKDGQEHLIKDLSTLNLPQDILSEALRHLLNEEVVAVDIANIYLP